MTTEDIRWLQRFENLEKSFEDLKDTIDFIGPLSQYEKDEEDFELYGTTSFIDEDKKQEIIEKRIYIKALIKTFELTYELFINAFKDLLAKNGYLKEDLNKGSKVVLEFALKAGYIEHDRWAEMVNDRNLSVHNYNEEQSLEILEKIIKNYYPAMKKSYKILKKESIKQKSEQEED